ncbi:MAG: peptidoglycan-binding protein [Candidatus Pacebacteria bacterium]|nr:peptidoglycan-binding protein [Candidatus Paceibacterota bacterium]
MIKKTILTLALVAVFAVPVVSHAAFQDDLLAQIQNLLTLVASLQQQLAGIDGETTVSDFVSCVAKTGIVLESYPRQCVYNGQNYVEIINDVAVPPISFCPVLSQNLWQGKRGTNVSSLQQFLRSVGKYTYPEITGYFGALTEDAVRAFQCEEIGVCFGSPETTGYGTVGPVTRKAISRICGGTPVVPIPIVPTPNPVVCTLEYAPVCGQQQIQCITTPCNPINNTYSNLCQLKASGAQFLHEGQCRINEPISREPVIHGFTGPTVLRSGSTGVWEIKASDPQNGPLSYKVDGVRKDLPVHLIL